MTRMSRCYKVILDFLNSVKNPEDIAKYLIDEANLGVTPEKPYNQLLLATRIIKERNSLAGHKFKSIYEILKIEGVNKEIVDAVCLNLQPLSSLYPALLFPVRLETRFKGKELWVRIYPDDITIETHDQDLTESEAAAGFEYRTIIGSARTDEEKKGAWREIARRFGSRRAAWIVKKVNEPNPKQTSWTKAPSVKVLPDRFAVFLYKQEECVYHVLGNIIPSVLPVMASPNSTINNEDSLFDNPAKWVSDFETACNIGMAVKIKLKSGDDGIFSKVIAVGLNRSKDEREGAELLTELIENHHYTTGFSFLPHGTPTNNTENARSAYTTADNDYDTSYQREILGTGASGNVRSAAERLSKALGISSSLFENCNNAVDVVDSYCQELQETLWPALGDYFLTYMLPNPLEHESRYALWKHFKDFVKARGPLPAICAGKQPYAILPVTNLYKWKWSALDKPISGKVAAQDLHQFDAKLHAALMVLFDRWFALSQQEGNIPCVGKSDDRDDEILKILAMEPTSVSYHIRPNVDAGLVGWLLLNVHEWFFGPSTIFHDLGHTPDEWAFKWAQEWVKSNQEAAKLLRDLAHATDESSNRLLTALIMNIFSWGKGEDLKDVAPLVLDPPTYLSSFEDGIPDPDISKGLLFDLLRRAFVYQQQPDRLLTTQLGEQVKLVYEFVHNAKVITISTHEAEIVRKDAQLLVLEVKITYTTGAYTVPFSVKAPTDGKVIKLFVHAGDTVRLDDPLILFEKYPTTEETLKKAIEEIDKSKIGGKAIEGLFRDVLDLHTHRLDAWLTSFATKRLHSMRQHKEKPQPGKLQKKVKKYDSGIHIGSYGWVENLERNQQSATVGEGGYIHAPSVAQAAAGAVLRNAYITHKDDETGNSFRINLTSERVRCGLRLLEGVREGQELSALLGYQFERGLHDQGQDVFIDTMRTLYPLIANKETQLDGEPVEAVAARNVVDGLALSKAWSAKENKVVEATAENNAIVQELDKLLDSLDSVSDLLLYESMFHAVQGNYERSGAALEATAGIVRPPEIESIKTPMSGVSVGHRVCLLLSGDDTTGIGRRGSAEPRLAAWFGSLLGPLENIGCTAQALQLDINTATEEELKNIPGIDEDLAQSIVTRRQEQGNYTDISELALVGMSSDLIASISDYAAVEPLASEIVLLSDLGIGPLDFLYLSSKQPNNEETELEQRIKYYVRSEHGLGPNAKIAIDFSRSPADFSRSMSEAVEFARHILNLVAGSKYVKPETLLRPEDGNQTAAFLVEDYQELLTRVEGALTQIGTDLSNDDEGGLIQASTTSDSIFLTISEYGIEGSIPLSPKDPDVEVRKKTIINTIEKRQTACRRLVGEADEIAYPDDGTNSDFGKAIERLVDAMKALFGDDFVVLPTCSAPNPVDLQNAIDQTNILGNFDLERVYLWMQQVAQTHTAVRRLEDMLMVGDAWISTAVTETTVAAQEITVENPLSLRVAQLPYNSSRRWLALSDTEGLTTEEIESLQNDLDENGRPRAVLSIVCLAPDPINFNEKICGVVVDQWDELIPGTVQQTGVSFQFDKPNSQPPQALLLAVPGVIDLEKPYWNLEQVRDIVKDTMDLAKIRLVDLDAFRHVGRFSPALFLPSDPARPFCIKKKEYGYFDDYIRRIVGSKKWQDFIDSLYIT